MHPELFRIFDFPIRSFGILAVTGFLVALYLIGLRAERHGVPKERATDMAMWTFLAGIIGARIVWVLQDWGHYSQHPLDIIKITAGGLTSFGGIILGSLVAFFYVRRQKISGLVALDLVGPPALIAFAIGRIGCFLNGCCYGTPWDGAWAVPIHPEGGGPVYMGHPAQIYDTVLLCLAALWLFWHERQTVGRHAKGQYFALFCVLYGATRFVYEFFRMGASSQSSIPGFALTDAHLAAIGIIAFGAVMYWLVKKRARSETATDAAQVR